MHWITPYTEMYQSIIMQHFPHISLLTSTTQPKLPSHEKPPWYQKCHFIYVLWLHVAANIKAYSRVNNYIPLFPLYSYYKLLWHQPVDAIDVGKELRRDVLSHFIVPEKKIFMRHNEYRMDARIVPKKCKHYLSSCILLEDLKNDISALFAFPMLFVENSYLQT